MKHHDQPPRKHRTAVLAALLAGLHSAASISQVALDCFISYVWEDSGEGRSWTLEGLVWFCPRPLLWQRHELGPGGTRTPPRLDTPMMTTRKASEAGKAAERRKSRVKSQAGSLELEPPPLFLLHQERRWEALHLWAAVSLSEQV